MSTLDDLPLRDDLRGQVPYGAPQLDVAIRLNVNENPYPPPPEMVDAVAAAVAEATRGLNRYPDREASELRAALAAYLAGEAGVELAPAQVWAANGSNEIMLQLMQAFGGPGRRALGFAPTYSMYPDYCRDTFTEWVTVPRRADFSIDLEAARASIAELAASLVVLASPNNPTGTAVSLPEIEALYEATVQAGGMLVVDEAYAEFRRPGTASAVELLAGRPRLVVTRTMSKAFALAGARLGYFAADPAVVDAVRLVRLPYHLSAVSQAVARVALAHAEALQGQLALLRHERDAMVGWLRAQGLQVPDTDANFVLFGRFGDRHAVWGRLLERGVLIRETGPDEWLRVSIGTPEENAIFRTALTETLAETPAEEPA